MYGVFLRNFYPANFLLKLNFKILKKILPSVKIFSLSSHNNESIF